MKAGSDLLSGMEPRNDYSPERNLWFAVIEKAIKDYCFFFDLYFERGLAQLSCREEITPTSLQTFNIKAVAELNRLRWFLFEKIPEEFNLQYLAIHLYEDGEGMADKLRAEIAQQFALHLKQVEEKNQFSYVLSYIKNNTKAHMALPSNDNSKLKKKRYRPVKNKNC